MNPIFNRWGKQVRVLFEYPSDSRCAADGYDYPESRMITKQNALLFTGKLIVMSVLQ